MRKIKIVADTSCDLLKLNNTDFAYAPMKIITDDKEFLDDDKLDVDGMVDFLDRYKGKSKSSCPNTNDGRSETPQGHLRFCLSQCG